MNHLSPDELQNIMIKYKGWVNKLGSRYLGGQRLENEGVVLQDKSSEPITDGPFLESKEIIAGYFLIAANDMEEATELAQSSPHLGLYSIQIRPISFPKMN